MNEAQIQTRTHTTNLIKPISIKLTSLAGGLGASR